MNRELTEDEEYAIEIQEWLVGLEEAVEAIKEGKPLTAVHLECLESAVDSLTNTFAEELGVAHAISEAMDERLADIISKMDGDTQ